MRYVAVGVVGFVLWIAATVVALATLPRSSLAHTPPTIPPATAVRVTLYPANGLGPSWCREVDVPPADMERAVLLLTPEAYYTGGVHDFITPLVAEAVITHPGGGTTHVLIRDGGVNPAVVSVDGRNYFYAVNHPTVGAGATDLMRMVNEIARGK